MADVEKGSRAQKFKGRVSSKSPCYGQELCVMAACSR